jgi:hypothetical protein
MRVRVFASVGRCETNVRYAHTLRAFALRWTANVPLATGYVHSRSVRDRISHLTRSRKPDSLSRQDPTDLFCKIELRQWSPAGRELLKKNQDLIQDKMTKDVNLNAHCTLFYCQHY